MVNNPFSCDTASGYLPNADGTRCECSAGYQPQDQGGGGAVIDNTTRVVCEPCTNGKYKADAGNQPCDRCPFTAKDERNENKMDTNNVQSSTSLDDCGCKVGMLLNNTDGAENATCVSCDEMCYDKLGISGDRADPAVDSKDPETWCVECGEHGVRMNDVEVKAGWWRSDPMSSFIYQCNPADDFVEPYCSGWKANASTTIGTNSTFDVNAQCKEGHAGVLCTTCIVGFALDPKSGACSVCSKASFQMFVVALGTVLFLFYIIRSSINSAEDEDRISTMLFKVGVSFLMGQKEVLGYRSDWMDELKSAFNMQSDVSTAARVDVGTTFPTIDCFFADEPSDARHYTKVKVYLFVPILALIVPAIPLGLKGLYLRCRAMGMHPDSAARIKFMDKLGRLKEFYMASAVVLLYNFYPVKRPTDLSHASILCPLFLDSLLLDDSQQHRVVLSDHTRQVLPALHLQHLPVRRSGAPRWPGGHRLRLHAPRQVQVLGRGGRVLLRPRYPGRVRHPALQQPGVDGRHFDLP